MKVDMREDYEGGCDGGMTREYEGIYMTGGYEGRYILGKI